VLFVKKKYFFISFIIFCFIGLTFFIIQVFDVFHTYPIVTLNDLSATQYEERTNVSFIKDIKYGKVVSKEKLIDTATPGEKKVVVIIENNYGKKRKYQFFVNIVEKE
jgi:hypothetical protein